MESNLIRHIKQYVNPDENQCNTILEHVTSKTLKNKEYIQEEGEICRNIFFVEKGCLRMFFNNEKGSEQTTYFALENWWLTDYFCFLGQNASRYYIQAVGKTELITISRSNYELLLEQIPSLERYFRIIMERAVAASQERMKLLYSLSKEELYHHFNTYFPEFIQKVPQYMIASFLGLTPEYVSEIRKKERLK